MLKLLIRGEWQVIDENQNFVRSGKKNIDPDNGHQWQFLGVSFHHWREGIDKSFKEIWDDPECAVGGLLWDIDHGTTRKWGGSYCGRLPRITKAEKGDI